MNQATPATRDLARLLLELEVDATDRREQNAGQAHAMLRVLEKLRAHLTRLVGITGFQALLARALVLAKPEARWLKSVRVPDDATLEGFSEGALQQSAETVAEGSRALLAQLLGLLVTFVGQAITLHLVQDVWPAAHMDAAQMDAAQMDAAQMDAAQMDAAQMDTKETEQ